MASASNEAANCSTSDSSLQMHVAFCLQALLPEQQLDKALPAFEQQPVWEQRRLNWKT